MLKDERVLVVEDDAEIAEVIEWNLYLAGYPVTVVPDGLAALRAVDEIRPRLITVDLNVPEVSGFRLLTLFKRYAPDVPVVVVTGSSFQEVEEVAHTGAVDFITKPFDPYELVRRVDYHLNHVEMPSPESATYSATSRNGSVVTVGLA